MRRISMLPITLALLLAPLASSAADEPEPVAYKINELPADSRLVAPRYLYQAEAEFTADVPVADADQPYLLVITPPRSDVPMVRKVLRPEGGDDESPNRADGSVATARATLDAGDWPDGEYAAAVYRARPAGGSPAASQPATGHAGDLESTGEPVAQQSFEVVRGWVDEHFSGDRKDELLVWLEHVNRPRDIWKKVPLWQNIDRVRQDVSKAFDDLKGLVLRSYFNPQLDRLQPYGVYVPQAYDPNEPMALLVLLHGSGGNYLNLLSDIHEGQELETNPMLVANAGAFRYQEYRHMALNDVLWVVEDMKAKYNVDPNRIYLQGISLGGRGCLEIPALVPGVFAAASPQGVYGAFQEASDLALYNALGEYARWQIARWDIRSYLPNLAGFPLQIIYGHRDRTTPALNALTFKHLLNARYGGAAEAVGFDRDHNISFPEYKWSDTRKWMLSKKLSQAEPSSVRFRVGALRYGTFRWVELLQMADPAKMADVEVTWDRNERLVRVEVANASSLRLRPPGPVDRVEVIEGDSRWELDVGEVSAESGLVLQRGPEGWHRPGAQPGAAAPPNARKGREATCGPIWNICAGSAPLLAVYGTGGSEAETANLRKLAEHVARLDVAWGEDHFPVVADTDVTAEQKSTHALLLVGDVRTNRLLAGHDWPFDLEAIGEGKGISVGSETYTGERDVLAFVYPSPFQQGRLVYVVSPARPASADAAPRPADTWSIATWQDWVVLGEGGRRGRGEILQAGTFDNRWQPGPSRGKVVRPRYMNWE
ncbi:MAG: hypothetical protein ACOC93_05500 [Planctomycetota bacterium]